MKNVTGAKGPKRGKYSECQKKSKVEDSRLCILISSITTFRNIPDRLLSKLFRVNSKEQPWFLEKNKS